MRDFDKHINTDPEPGLELELVRFMRNEMDERQAAVLALKHVWGMSDIEVINHTGMHEAEVHRLTKAGALALLEGFPARPQE